jgi:hypothetical protein
MGSTRRTLLAAGAAAAAIAAARLRVAPSGHQIPHPIYWRDQGGPAKPKIRFTQEEIQIGTHGIDSATN